MIIIKSICKHCKGFMSFSIDDPISKQIYCCDVCWQADWIKNGKGLVHPTCPEVILNFAKEYGGIDICKQVLKAIEN